MNAAVLLLMALTACQGQRPQTPEPTGGEVPAQRDIILIVLDGLRADPPGVDAAEAALYHATGRRPYLRHEAAYAQSIAPFVSLGSLLAGQYPSTLSLCGVRWSEPDGKVDQFPWCAKLPEDRETLPKVLEIYGWKTAFFTSRLPGAAGFAPLFGTWTEIKPKSAGGGTDWGGLAQSLEDWRRQNAGSNRFSLIVVEDLSLMERVDLMIPLRGLSPWTLIRPLHAPKINSDAYYSLYQSEASRVGQGLRAVLDNLGPDSSADIILTSTRGINLGEGTGSFSVDLSDIGGDILLDRTMRVPLSFLSAESSSPDAPDTRKDARPTELVDIFPTIMAMAGATPPSRLAGSDLFAANRYRPLTAYCEYGDMLALREDDNLLIFRSLRHGMSALDPALTEALAETSPKGEFLTLHRVSEDPFQKLDLVAQDQSTTKRMLESLLARRKAATKGENTLSPDQIWNLRMSPDQGYW